MTHIPTIEYDARHTAHVELIIAENEHAQSNNRGNRPMTFPVPSGERRRIFFVLCVLAALGVITIILATTGHADVLALPMQSNGWSVCQGGVCQWGSGALPSPNIRHVPQPQTDEEKAAAEKADREWVRECDPKLVRDHLGVKRYVYSKPGCEFGSPE